MKKQIILSLFLLLFYCSAYSMNNKKRKRSKTNTTELSTKRVKITSHAQIQAAEAEGIGDLLLEELEKIQKRLRQKALNNNLLKECKKTFKTQQRTQQQLRKITELIDKGADINAQTRHLKYTPIVCAIKSNNLPVIQLLLRYKPDLNQKVSKFGHSTKINPFVFACTEKNIDPEIILKLLKHKPTIDSSSLQLTLKHGSQTTIDHLIKVIDTPLRDAMLPMLINTLPKPLNMHERNNPYYVNVYQSTINKIFNTKNSLFYRGVTQEVKDKFVKQIIPLGWRWLLHSDIFGHSLSNEQIKQAQKIWSELQALNKLPKNITKKVYIETLNKEGLISSAIFLKKLLYADKNALQIYIKRCRTLISYFDTKEALTLKNDFNIFFHGVLKQYKCPCQRFRFIQNEYNKNIAKKWFQLAFNNLFEQNKQAIHSVINNCECEISNKRRENALQN